MHKQHSHTHAHAFTMLSNSLNNTTGRRHWHGLVPPTPPLSFTNFL